MSSRFRYFQDPKEIQELLAELRRGGTVSHFVHPALAKSSKTSGLLEGLGLSDDLALVFDEETVLKDGLESLGSGPICLVIDSDAASRISGPLAALSASEAVASIYLFIIPTGASQLAVEQSARLLTLQVFGQEEPQDHEYDSIPHFVDRAFPQFENKIEDLCQLLYKLFDDVDIEALVDVGCGDGLILLRLAKLLGGKFRYVGIDRSPMQIGRAKSNLEMNCEQLNVQFESLAFEDWRSRALLQDQRYALLFLGQTLAHIGPTALSSWLKNNRESRPQYIVFDLYGEWARYQGQIYHCTPLPVRVDDGIVSSATLFTINTGGKVQRGIELTYHDLSTGAPIANHRLSTTQYPNVIQDYEDVLESHGYEMLDRTTYRHGWGDFMLRFARAGDRLPDDWPAPDESEGRKLNESWYHILQNMWTRAEMAKCNMIQNPRQATPLESDLIEGLDFFPVAILPFESDAVWARYLKVENRETDSITAAWMKLVDRNTEDTVLPRRGHLKSRRDAPYAPGLFDALMGDVPAAFVKRIHDAVFPFALNLWDDRLELEEIRVLGGASGTAFYALPLYPLGLPSFCLIGRCSNLRHVPPLTVMGVFQREIDKYERFFSEYLRDIGWFEFLSDCERKVGFTKLSELPKGARSKVWKSWVETIPGESLHDTPKRAFEAGQLKEFHAKTLNDVAKLAHEKVSKFLLDRNFFDILQQSGCGHEALTKYHHSEATGLEEKIGLLAQLNEIDEIAFAKEYIGSLIKIDPSTLPDDDTPEQCQARGPEYQSANFDFQSFKSLFCRNDRNRGDRYRLSSLMIWTYLSFAHPEIPISIAGIVRPQIFQENDFVRPKLVFADAWDTVKCLSKIIDVGPVQHVAINGNQSEELLTVTLVFNAVIGDYGLAGGSSGLFFGALRALVTEFDENFGRARALALDFRNKSKITVRWLAQAAVGM